MKQNLLYLSHRILSRLWLSFISLTLMALSLSAQENITLSWPLTSPDRVMAPSGEAHTGFGTGRDVGRVTFDRDYGAMAGGWHSTEMNPAAFYEYRFTPAEGTSLSFSQLKVDISLASGEMYTAVHYSTDGFRSGGTPLGQPLFFYTNTPQTLTLATNISVSHPDTLRIRIYAWGSQVPNAEFNNRNFRLEGAVYQAQMQYTTGDTLPAESEYVQHLIKTKPEGGSGSREIVPPFTDPGTFTWICPDGVTCIKVECWGGGGRGGDRRNTYSPGATGGGGGGAYSRTTIQNVIPGNTYHGNVGNGSISNSPGGDSWFGPTSLVTDAIVLGKGGSSVPDNNQNGGLGGAAANGIGAIRYSGGNGGNVVSGNSGGGGGGAGSTGPGGNASGTTAGTGTPLYGGSGGQGRTSNGDGNDGLVRGGGGGGEKMGWFNDFDPGDGANGQVIITYISLFNITPAGNHCVGTGTPVTIGLDDSETGVTYQLYRDGSPIIPTIILPGTGSNLTFSPAQSALGTYTVVATLDGSSCEMIMNGEVNIITIPGSPGPISGEDFPCAGSTQTYSVANVAGVTFTWSVPAGYSIISGQGTHIITVTIGSAIGPIAVTPSNECGNGSGTSLVIRPISPPKPALFHQRSA